MGSSCFKSKGKTYPAITLNPLQNGISYFSFYIKSEKIINNSS